MENFNFKTSLQTFIQKFTPSRTGSRLPKRIVVFAQAVGLICIFGVLLKNIWNLAYRFLYFDGMLEQTMGTGEAILYAAASLGFVLLTDLLYND